MSDKKLVRLRDDRMISGVASGIAHYVGIDPIIIRLVFVLMALTGGHGILVYIVLALIMPEEYSVVAKAEPFDEEEIVIKDA